MTVLCRSLSFLPCLAVAGLVCVPQYTTAFSGIPRLRSHTRPAVVVDYWQNERRREPSTNGRRPTTFLRENPISLGTDEETLEVTDVEEAIEALEEQLQDIDLEEAIEALEHAQAEGGEDFVDDGSQQIVVVQEDDPDMLEEIEEFDKDEMTGEIEDMIEDDTAEHRKSSSLSKIAAGDASPTTTEEAAVSASLYMNPATAKIASNLIITWEPAVAEILDRMCRVSNPERPFLVGVVGIPGSGKSTSADIVATLLSYNHESKEEEDERAIVMPMDGFHLPLQTLADMPDAADVIYRRGAPDTFDPASLERDLERIAYGTDRTVSIPGFDHAKGDPVPKQHTFDRSKHQIVICEGIYLLHDDDGWENIKSFFDWTIYIDADVDGCIERLKERNKVIPGYTPEEIETRCEIVDRANAEMSRDSAKKYASQIVSSGAS